MRVYLRSTVAVITVALIGVASASAQIANPQAPSNPAVNTQDANNPGAPAPGANSFTEAQARTRIEARGYTNISGLTKDASGVWRGTATRDGKNQQVAVDYQGNVAAQ
jgi:putative membrane protein